MTVLLVVVYLLGGILHDVVCEAEFAVPTEAAATAMLDHGAEDFGKCCIPGQHCHGCAFVSIPAPVEVAAIMASAVGNASLPRPRSGAPDHPPGVDPPPPKGLT